MWSSLSTRSVMSLACKVICIAVYKCAVNMYFTITAEILASSLANFYRQYADRHMNLKFVRRFVIVKNKLTAVFHASVLLLTMNFVITLSK